MKVSKYNHSRCAVTKNKTDNMVSGKMYKHPGELENINQRIVKKERTDNWLYNLFSPVNEGMPPKKKEKTDKDYAAYCTKQTNFERRHDCSLIVGELNKHLNRIVFEIKGDNNKIRIISDSDKILSELKEGKTLRKIEESATNRGESLYNDERTAEEIVTLALRKSLKENEVGAIKFLESMGKKNIPTSDMRQIEEFIDAVSKDFNRLNEPGKDDSPTLGQYISKSIYNQNLVVQAGTDNGYESIQIKIPIPTDKDSKDQNKKTTHKTDEKNALNRFLLDYADLNENSRMDILWKIRRIVDVYFEAPDIFDKAKNYMVPKVVKTDVESVWKRHEEGKTDVRSFVDIRTVVGKTVKTFGLEEDPESIYELFIENRRIDKITEAKILDALVESIRNRNIICYRYAESVTRNDSEGKFFEDENMNKFWIHFIENSVEKLFKHRLRDNLYRLKLGFLREKVWKDILNYISIKYIAIGKAVYYFACQDVWREIEGKTVKDDQGEHTEGSLSPGEIHVGRIIDTECLTGLSSFDYEMIKAYETLQREVAVHVAFAGNNFSRAAVNIPDKGVGDKGKTIDKSDILLWNNNDINTYKKYDDSEDEIKAVLQFFGGRSTWDIDIKKNYMGLEHSYPYDVLFINDIRKALYSLRNETFHFKTCAINDENNELFAEMFKMEAVKVVSLDKDRFYANNLPMFYKEDDLKSVLDRLYGEICDRAAQVPSFGRIVGRTSCRDFLCRIFDKPNDSELIPVGWDKDDIEKWESGFYYLLKEIYYNDFLQNPESKRFFVYEVDHISDEADNTRAVSDFQSRIRAIKKDTDLSEICQLIMTEYNYQNNQRKVSSSADSIFDRKKYQHYKLFLERALRNAFAKYLKNLMADNGVYSFLTAPQKQNMPKKEVFLSKWSSSRNDNLIKNVEDDPDLQKWYIMCRFLPPRSLNLLVGSLRSYIQYVGDIEKRAKSANSKRFKEDNVIVDRIKCIIPIVDICIKLAGAYSGKVEDYFCDANEYAEYLTGFIDYREDNGQVAFEQLKAFCTSNNMPQGVYTDQENVIVNRNLMMTKLYGMGNLLKDIIPHLKKEDLNNYYEAKEKISDYTIKGCCNSKDEQLAVIDYQRKNNKIELRTLGEYAEIINELLGQLINWSYLRERDLMYFQLGFHYMCLNKGGEIPDGYDRVKTANNKTYTGTILRQILGLNIGGIGILLPNNEGEYEERVDRLGSGAKIPTFLKYSEYVLGKDCTDEDEKKKLRVQLYNAGLEVFEVIPEHDCIIDIRDYIDHFHYYNDSKRSILDLYSEVYDRFFTYDVKYKKSVYMLLQNILLRHNIILSGPVFKKGEKEINRKGKTKEKALIGLGGMSSNRFSYKYITRDPERGEEVEEILEVDAKNREFMETVWKILYYHAESDELHVIVHKETTKTNQKINEDKSDHLENGDKKESHKKNGNTNQAEKKYKTQNGNNSNLPRRDKNGQQSVSSGYSSLKDALAKAGFTN